MVIIKYKPLDEVEITIGKNVVSDLKTIQDTVSQILKDNLDLRSIKYRHVVRLLVEDKLRKRVPEETVPRSCRAIQSEPPAGKGLWKPLVEDNREEREKEYHDFYSKNGGE